jgi:hypothetical protein
MQISSDQALDALEQVQAAQQRISVLRGYGFAAPHFVLWGCIWFLGYLATYQWPAGASALGLTLDGVGVVGSALIGRTGRAQGVRASQQWRVLGLMGTCVAFMMVTELVFQPREAAQAAVFPPLLAAGIYIGLGLWRGLRWVIAGLVLAALALAGFFLMRPYLPLWLAVAGGGTLVLTGLWLRRS